MVFEMAFRVRNVSGTFEKRALGLLLTEALTSRSNWNLEVLVFVEGGKPDNPEKNSRSKARTNNNFNPHETASKEIEPASQR